MSPQSHYLKSRIIEYVTNCSSIVPPCIFLSHLVYISEVLPKQYCHCCLVPHVVSVIGHTPLGNDALHAVQRVSFCWTF